MRLVKLGIYEIISVITGILSGVLFVRLIGISAKGYLAEIQALASIGMSIGMMGVQYQIGTDAKKFGGLIYLILALIGSLLVILVNVISPTTLDPLQIIISSLYSFSVIIVSLVQMRIIFDANPQKYFYLQIIPPLVMIIGSLINQYLVETDYRLIILISILFQISLATYYIKSFNKGFISPIRKQILNVLKGVKYIPYSLMSAAPIAVSVLIIQDDALKGVLSILISTNQLIIKLPRIVMQYTLGNSFSSIDYKPLLVLNILFNLSIFIFGLTLIPKLYNLDESLILLPFSIIIFSSIFLQRIARFDANLIKIDKINIITLIKFISVFLSGISYLLYYSYLSELISACALILIMRFINYLLCLYYENYK